MWNEGTGDPVRVSPKKDPLLKMWVEVVYLESTLKKYGGAGKWARKGKRSLNAVSSRKLLPWETSTGVFWGTWEASIGKYRTYRSGVKNLLLASFSQNHWSPQSFPHLWVQTEWAPVPKRTSKQVTLDTASWKFGVSWLKQAKCERDMYKAPTISTKMIEDVTALWFSQFLKDQLISVY